MIGVGSFRTRDCQGATRRSFLRLGATLPFAASLAQLAGQTPAAEPPRARSVVLIWLVGGPSHLDLFDPKPRAPSEFRGPFASIGTRLPGVQFSELLPRLAACNDRYSIIRTNVNYDGGHRPAGSIAWTCAKASPGGGEGGAENPASYPPHMGAVLARERGHGDLPGFISLANGPVGDGVGPSLGYGGGSWGKRFDPFMIGCSKQGQVSIPDLELLAALTPQRLANRQALLDELNRVRQRADTTPFDRMHDVHRQAYELLTTPRTLKAFDLSQETAQTRQQYGRTSFGQSCLLGRRLVEAGVPFVQVNWSQFAEVFYPFSDYGWDTHADNFELLADWHGPLLDRVLSTLLGDLQDRGLLESTLVVCMGEFGRTPRINNIGSRDHWHHCYFSLWAGAGIKPGQVIGESDPRGEHPLTEPITPEMVGTTMLELAGVSTAQRAALNVIQGGTVIEQLLG